MSVGPEVNKDGQDWQDDRSEPGPMGALERSRRVREEADLVMGEIGLHDILRPYGCIVMHGSYRLDVMVYPDIDLYIPKVSIEELFRIGGRIAEAERVCEVVFQRSKVENLPGGLYLKVRVEYGDWGRPWKVDIWSLDEALIARRVVEMEHFKGLMTEALREEIIRYKTSILTSERRTPMYSGYWVYRAFLDEGLRDWNDVTRYLVANGIRME